MLMARDTARDEAQKLHRKWLKHQAFMAELARNKEWLAKIEQVSRGDQGMMMKNGGEDRRGGWGGQMGRAGGQGEDAKESVDGGCGGSKIKLAKVETMSSLSCQFIICLGEILGNIIKVILL